MRVAIVHIGHGPDRDPFAQPHADLPHSEIEGLPDRGSAVRGGCVMPVWGAP